MSYRELKGRAPGVTSGLGIHADWEARQIVEGRVSECGAGAALADAHLKRSGDLESPKRRHPSTVFHEQAGPRPDVCKGGLHLLAVDNRKAGYQSSDRLVVPCNDNLLPLFDTVQQGTQGVLGFKGPRLPS